MAKEVVIVGRRVDRQYINKGNGERKGWNGMEYSEG